MTEDLSEFQNPEFALFSMKLAAASDRKGGTEHRRWLPAGLSGQVVEVGAGLNFPHYPARVTELIAVEPDDQPSPVTASAWSTQLNLNSAADPRLAEFIAKYMQGPQTLEPGAPCSGGTGTPTG